MKGRIKVSYRIMGNIRDDNIAVLMSKIPGAKNIREEPFKSPLTLFVLALKDALDSDCSHICILQDDALICKDFVETVPILIVQFPDRVVCPFHSTSLIRCDMRRAVYFLSYSIYVYAIIWPKDLANVFITFVNNHVSDQEKCFHDDRLIETFLRLVGRHNVITFPHIVQHGGAHSSALGHHSPNPTISHNFLGEDVSGLSVDWTRRGDNVSVRHWDPFHKEWSAKYVVGDVSWLRFIRR